jgi:hypothetical protein
VKKNIAAAIIATIRSYEQAKIVNLRHHARYGCDICAQVYSCPQIIEGNVFKCINNTKIITFA